MKIRKRVIVEGVVQGVSFRAKLRDFAIDHNVKGCVKNRLDGRVEAVLEGDIVQVEKVISFCRQGPDSAVVLNVNVLDEQYKNEFFGFTVKSS